MRDGILDDLVKYRLEAADEKLKSAKILLDNGQFKDSIGRSYYAIFSAVRALLATRRVDFSKHAAVIAYFQKEYIKTGILETEYSKHLQSAFQIRNSCDYDDFFIASKSDAEKQYARATELLNRIKTHLFNEE